MGGGGLGCFSVGGASFLSGGASWGGITFDEEFSKKIIGLGGGRAPTMRNPGYWVMLYMNFTLQYHVMFYKFTLEYHVMFYEFYPTIPSYVL